MKDFLSAFWPTAPFFEELKDKIDNRKIDIVDAAAEDDYIITMRRRVRPVCFPAPSEQNRRLAERIILDSAQNGTLDLPAYFHAPIETGIISLLCKTRITPNQLRLQVLSSDAAPPRPLRLAGSASESSLLSYLVSSMDWTESSRASKSK